MKQAETKRNA